MELSGKRPEPVGVACCNDLITGHGGIEIVAGSYDRPEIIAHDDGIQLMHRVAIKIGVLEDLVIIIAEMTCGKTDRRTGDKKMTFHEEYKVGLNVRR